MQNCPRQLAMQSCVLCSFVRCGTSNQIEKKRKKKKTLPYCHSYKDLTWDKHLSLVLYTGLDLLYNQPKNKNKKIRDLKVSHKYCFLVTFQPKV